MVPSVCHCFLQLWHILKSRDFYYEVHIFCTLTQRETLNKKFSWSLWILLHTWQLNIFPILLHNISAEVTLAFPEEFCKKSWNSLPLVLPITIPCFAYWGKTRHQTTTKKSSHVLKFSFYLLHGSKMLQVIKLLLASTLWVLYDNFATHFGTHIE